MVLYIVIPCYREEEALPHMARRLLPKLQAYLQSGRVDPRSRILLVNDGSPDGTWPLITRLHEENPLFSGLSLSRNCGHQNALLAGLLTAAEEADAVISLDADLQDDIDAMDEMLDRFAEGCDIVYGVRRRRETDTAFKRATAQGFYRLMQALGVDIVYNHADYRLLSRRAIQALSGYSEVNLFLRGIVPQLGFRSATVLYDRAERVAGETKYPFQKMLRFAAEGVTSFSIKPIRLVLWTGVLVFLVSLVMLLWAVVTKLLGRAVTGWSSLICSIWMLGGLQLLGLGIVGEYIGKVYAETKRRPRYIIESFLHTEEPSPKTNPTGGKHP